MNKEKLGKLENIYIERGRGREREQKKLERLI